MTVNFNDSKFKADYAIKKKAFLHAVGHAAQNQAAEISHVKSGLSKNAKHYVLSDGTFSGFGTYPGEKPGIKYKGSPPQTPDTIKLIAPLHYDIYLERRFGILKRTIDLIRPQIKALARIMKI